MVDPKFITKYGRNDYELEELAIFSVCVAGKNAHATARAVDKLLTLLRGYVALSCARNGEFFIQSTFRPLVALHWFCETIGIRDWRNLALTMKQCGIGCHSGFGKVPGRAEVCYNLSKKIVSNSDYLRSCTTADLESIKGIGSKTARFFILHTRPKQRICAVDTHILKYLKEQGVPNVPKTTPPKASSAYYRLEEAFLSICDKLSKDYAEHDLWVWNHYSLDGLSNRATMLAEGGPHES